MEKIGKLNRVGVLLALLTLTTLFSTSAAATLLLNVDFDYRAESGGSGEVGFAAIGQTTNDFWNFYTRDNGSGGYRTYGAVTNLRRADAAATSVGLIVSNAPGAWTSLSPDSMFSVYLYDLNGQPVVVTTTNLPASQYDVLIYGADGNFEVAVGGVSSGIKTSYGVVTTNPPIWMEGVQYVRFRNVVVDAGQPLVLTIRHGIGGYAQLAGMQIVESTPTAPIISAQPTNCTVIEGETAAFTVIASGYKPLAYQWSLNGTNIVNATNAMLMLTNVRGDDAGNYAVVVSNSVGSVLSSNATLIVNPVPPCSSAPTNLMAWWQGESDAQDFVGGNNGIMHTVNFSSGKVGQALNFNGTNADVRIPKSASLNVGSGSGLTVESWINPADVKVQRPLVEWNSGSGGLPFGVHLWISVAVKDLGGGSGCLFVNLKDTTQNYHILYSPPGLIVTNIFQHLAMTYDKNTGLAALYLNGLAIAQTNLGVFIPDTASDLYLGFRPYGGGVGTRFAGQMDEVSLYNRALSGIEIQNIYNASVAGKCIVPTAPFITAQPQSNSVLESASATFAVSAGGTPSLSYQWRLNGVDISDATNRTLMLTNVQLSQAGNYSVLVSNASGSVTSSNAALTVIPLPAEIRIIGTNAMSGTSVTVPLQLVAKGNENAIGFSLNFNTQRLIYANAALGAGAGGASLLLNTTGVSTGRLGIAVALASDTTFTADTQQIATITFTSPVNTSTQSVSTTINFADTPVLRQVSDTNAFTLSANYFSGNIALLPTDLEGDVTPRPNGDRAVTITDWVQAGRFAALIDTPADGGEFQRADCAPRGTLGDGQIKVTDWVQAGRYAAGLDSPTAVGGSTAAVSGTKGGSLPKSGARQIQIADATAIEGVTATLAVNLQSQGDESALGFSVIFDPAKFIYSSATKGSAAGSATLNVNTNQAISGKVGLAIGLPIGNSFPAGSCEVIRVALKPKNAAVGSASVGFADQPLSRSVSDSAANELSATYVASTVTVNPLPTLNISVQGSNAILSWPLWAEGFDLQMSPSNAPMIGGWANPAADLQTNGGNRFMQMPVSSDAQYFRLQHP